MMLVRRRTRALDGLANSESVMLYSLSLSSLSSSSLSSSLDLNGVLAS